MPTCLPRLPALPACLHGIPHPPGLQLLTRLHAPCCRISSCRCACFKSADWFAIRGAAARYGGLDSCTTWQRPAAARSCAATSPSTPSLNSPLPSLSRQSVGYPAALIAKGPGVPFLAGGPFMSAGPQVRCQVACKNWPRIHVRLEACMLRWLLRPNAWHRWAQCCRPQACRPD